MTELDQAQVDAFSAKMLEIMNGGMLSLAISIGYKIDLFETMSGLPPSTSEQISEAAGLQERYVREWLAAMVTGQIVEYDPAAGTYHLPAENASLITRTAGPNNMARFAQIIPLLASVEKEVVDSFLKGGGVDYSAYPEFMGLWIEANGERFDATITQEVLPLMPDVVEAMHQGIDVLDVGCGGGNVLNIMAKAFPNSRFIGYDFLEEGLADARAKAKALGSTNVRFVAKDVAALDEPGKYALIMAFDCIHDMAQPTKVLEGIAASLQPGGTFLMVDLAASSHLHENLDHPIAPWLYTTSVMHCMTVSLAQDGVGLGTCWGEQSALQMLEEAGFTSVDVRQIPSDIFNNYFIATRNPAT